MNTTKKLVMLALASAVAVGCGKDDNNTTTNNTTPNNTTANNTTANNTTVNNTTVNNTTVNNTTVNNTTVNNTTNTNVHTPHDFTCPNLVTPAGAIADLVGTHDFTDGCVGENAFALLAQLCPTGVLTSVVYRDFAGRMIVGDDGSFTVAQSSAFDAEIYVPDACAMALGGGTCDGVAAFIDGAAAGLSTTCADEPPNAGDCLCAVTGPGGARIRGTIADGANPGEATLTWLAKQADDTYTVQTRDIEFQTDGTTTIQRNTASTSTLTTNAAADASACETYCHGFMALCNTNPGVTAYTDTTDCVTQCAGFAPGADGDMAGDSLACRIYHLGAAADTAGVTNPNTHCPHAQAAPTAVCL